MKKIAFFRYDITYFVTRLTADSALLAAGADAVCAFVNDEIDAA